LSLVDLEQLSPQEIVLNYLLEVRGRGLFFAYSDLYLIEEWIRVCPDINELLVILGDTAPEYFQGQSSRKCIGVRNLAGYHKTVMSRIQERIKLGCAINGDF